MISQLLKDGDDQGSDFIEGRSRAHEGYQGIPDRDFDFHRVLPFGLSANRLYGFEPFILRSVQSGHLKMTFLKERHRRARRSS